MNQARWHATPLADLLQSLEATPAGLASSDAEERLRRHGPNAISAAPGASVARILLRQLRSVVVALLFVAAVVSIVMGDSAEAVAILVVLVINTAIGFTVELRAHRAMEALLRYQALQARVRRDGMLRSMSAQTLVPGDVIRLEEGDAIPADARLLEASELRVLESALTGESVAVEKEGSRDVPAEVPLPDRTNMLFMGTTVVGGSADAVVVETGGRTELGRIGQLVGALPEERTPLERKLDALGGRLVWMTLAASAALVVLGVWRGVGVATMLQAGIALAIAAVPEGLPAVATIALAIGLRRMARRNALIRRLHAVEALGATTIVCTDKTGTLTSGEMTATRIGLVDSGLEVTGTGYAPHGELRRGAHPASADAHPALAQLFLAAALSARAQLREASGAWTAIGDPTDAAMFVLASKFISAAQIREQTRVVRELPFSSARRYSAVFTELADKGAVVFVKGAPAQVLALCATVHASSGVRAITDDDRVRLQETNDRLAADGLRVIALATERTQAGKIQSEPLRDLTFLGVVGMQDPAAPGVAETIDALLRAGIRTIMLTGDQRLTAEAIARQLRLCEGESVVLDSVELAALDDAGLSARLRQTCAVSRVSPEDKLRVVALLQRSGAIVAMLGDGVNDAAALRKADVGVAMGRRGTDVARETAAVVLQDDRFPTIAAAVEEGRVIYDNIRKFVFYLFSCNLAEVLVLVVATLAGWPLPLTALQILWLNIVTDTFPALALAVEPGEPAIMERPPRDPSKALMSSRFMRAIALYAALIALVTLVPFGLLLRAGDAARAGTVAFMTLALAQTFHLGNARGISHVLSPRRIVSNPAALGALALVLCLQAAALYFAPLREVLRTVPLSTRDLLLCLVLGGIPALFGQLHRLRRSRHAHSD